LEPQYSEWIEQYTDHLQSRQTVIPDGGRTRQWSTQLPARPSLEIPSGF
jgi:hypothetical protein